MLHPLEHICTCQVSGQPLGCSGLQRLQSPVRMLFGFLMFLLCTSMRHDARVTIGMPRLPPLTRVRWSLTEGL